MCAMKVTRGDLRRDIESRNELHVSRGSAVPRGIVTCPRPETRSSWKRSTCDERNFSHHRHVPRIFPDLEFKAGNFYPRGQSIYRCEDSVQNAQLKLRRLGIQPSIILRRGRDDVASWCRVNIAIAGFTCETTLSTLRAKLATLCPTIAVFTTEYCTVERAFNSRSSWRGYSIPGEP